jgi:hypothetical protein
VNDLDDLRDAMRTTPDFEPRSLDLAVVMAAGGRLRRRRRLATGAASGLAVLALLVGGAQLLPARDGPRPVAPAAPAPASASASAPATDDASAEVLGEVVRTGLRVGDAERVLWVTSTDPGPLGIMSGRRLADGSLRPDVLANETDDTGREAGFHAGQAAMVVDGSNTLAFGYYVGPATRITARASGRKIIAKQATWSEDPSIVLFWFTPNQVKPGMELSGLTAYDSRGGKLPAGQPTFSVG